MDALPLNHKLNTFWKASAGKETPNEFSLNINKETEQMGEVLAGIIPKMDLTSSVTVIF